jgi:phage I-like protein
MLATASAVALPDGTAPEWVKLFGYGPMQGRNGLGPYTVRDAAHAAEIIATTASYQAGADAPIDYDHQTQMAPQNGGRAPASGWIKELAARDDGLYARTEWTAAAAQHIAAREYRYISPTFVHDRDGTVIRIVGAGLTNLPNLEIPAIASQTQGDPMDPAELIKQIRAALGLPDDTADDALIERCKALVTAAEKADKTPADQTTATASQVDLTRYVPMDVHLAVAGQLSTLQQSSATNEVTGAVEAAIREGKLTPGMKDWALAYANQDLGGFRRYVDGAPVLVATASQAKAPAPAPTEKPGLTQDQVDIAERLGLSATDYATALAETAR